MKNCLECGDAIAGREDKKFCCDGCRNSYNNCDIWIGRESINKVILMYFKYFGE